MFIDGAFYNFEEYLDFIINKSKKAGIFFRKYYKFDEVQRAYLFKKSFLSEADVFLEKFSRNKQLGFSLLVCSNLIDMINEENQDIILKLYRFFDNNKDLSHLMNVFASCDADLTKFNFNDKEKQAYVNAVKKRCFENHCFSFSSKDLLLTSINAFNPSELDELLSSFNKSFISYFAENLDVIMDSKHKDKLIRYMCDNIEKIHRSELVNVISNIASYDKSIILSNKEKFLALLDYNKSDRKFLNMIRVLISLGITEANDYLNNNVDKIIHQMVVTSYYGTSKSFEINGVDLSRVSGLEDEEFIVKGMIQELCELQDLEFKDVSYLASGLYCTVYKVGDYVIKLGRERRCDTIPNCKDILQPLIRGQFGNLFIEVQPVVRTDNISNSDMNKIYSSLEAQGIEYDDLDVNQVGYLDHPVKPLKFKRGDGLIHENAALAFYGEEQGNGVYDESLYEVGKLYIIDTDFLFKDMSKKNPEDVEVDENTEGSHVK